MTLEWSADEKLAGPILGILSGIGIVIEELVAHNLVKADDLARLFQTKIDEYRKTLRPDSMDAAAILDILKGPLVSEERKSIRRLLNESSGEA